MRVKKYGISLTEAERETLHRLTKRGEVSARKLRRAHILLLAEEGHRDAEIARMLHASESTVHRTRQRCAEEGVEAALSEKPRPGQRRKLDREGEAALVAIARGEPPKGRPRWTLRLLAEHLAATGLVASIDPETIRKVLKKHKCSLG